MRLLRRFARAEDGVLAPILAFALLPLAAIVGVAADYTALARLHDRLQLSTDASSLPLCKASAALSADQLRAIAQRILDTNMGVGAATADTPVVVEAPRSVSLTARADYKVLFSGLIGATTVPLSASSTCSANEQDFEVALVLDNTGSMANSSNGVTKIAALKQAATDFVTYLAGSTALSGHLRLSLVPFSAAVAVDPATPGLVNSIDMAGQSSLHWPNVSNAGASGFANRLDIFAKLAPKATDWAWAGCFESLPYPRNVQDGKPDAADPDSFLVPMFAPDEAGNGGSTSHTEKSSGKNQSTPNSYIDDATSATGCSTTPNDDATRMLRACKYAKPTNADSAGDRGPNWMCRSRPLTRLTADTNKIIAEIAAMQANGNTNIHEGVAWGWRTLSPLSIFGDGAAYTKQANNKIMVLMTDGMNTWTANSGNSVLKSYYSAYGYFRNADGSTPNSRLPPANANPSTDATARAAMDALTREACQNVRAAGIKIYTVGFSIPTDPIDALGLQLLKDCAGVASQAFVATDSAALIAAFQAIGQGIGRLRLSK